MKPRLTREERNDVARLIFEALCAQYPDRHFALAEQRGLDLSEPLADRTEPSVQPAA
jgi:hypothetical protein